MLEVTIPCQCKSCGSGVREERKEKGQGHFEIFEVMSHFGGRTKVSLFLGEKLVRLLQDLRQ